MICIYCGHPVAAEGTTIWPPESDQDRTGQDRPRCSDSACVTDQVETVWDQARKVVLNGCPTAIATGRPCPGCRGAADRISEAEHRTERENCDICAGAEPWCPEHVSRTVRT